MKTVYLYGGTGTYSGASNFEWDSPVVGSTHKFIMFLAQEINEPCENIALSELARFGFNNIQITVGKPIAVESLNDPQMQAFHKHYEGALSEGCSLVWYP